MEQFPNIGDVVIYHDPKGEPHECLVTAVWGNREQWDQFKHGCAINLVLISDNPDEKDCYGRQIKRQTSVAHKSIMPAHGNYWRWDAEEPNAYVAPAAV